MRRRYNVSGESWAETAEGLQPNRSKALSRSALGELSLPEPSTASGGCSVLAVSDFDSPGFFRPDGPKHAKNNLFLVCDKPPASDVVLPSDARQSGFLAGPACTRRFRSWLAVLACTTVAQPRQRASWSAYQKTVEVPACALRSEVGWWHSRAPLLQHYASRASWSACQKTVVVPARTHRSEVGWRHSRAPPLQTYASVRPGPHARRRLWYQRIPTIPKLAGSARCSEMSTPAYGRGTGRSAVRPHRVFRMWSMSIERDLAPLKARGGFRRVFVRGRASSVIRSVASPAHPHTHGQSPSEVERNETKPTHSTGRLLTEIIISYLRCIQIYATNHPSQKFSPIGGDLDTLNSIHVREGFLSSFQLDTPKNERARDNSFAGIKNDQKWKFFGRAFGTVLGCKMDKWHCHSDKTHGMDMSKNPPRGNEGSKRLRAENNC
ncbi:hypothetical protein C8R44DRAFT_745170 [Mycena epipterygia]|nr:hypothetical protein C8R44DRAFT_745170 [Mycena epipterygia]